MLRVHFIFFISIWHEQSDRWCVLSADTQKISQSLALFTVHVRPSEQDVLLELSSGLLHGGSSSLTLLVVLHEQEDGLLLLQLEDSISGVIVELHNGSETMSVDEGLHILDVEVAVVVISALVELFEEDHGVLFE